MMKIKKVFNNNVVIANNQQNQEVVVMGRGLAFQKRPENQSTLQKLRRPLY
ncbi:CAT RNA binding domain-containing protein [Halalkalibacter alkalisediminis]|uniref:CAT RNA binding domain-containing protein n=1 Tax=Halalkalibacter alkalisediminis TaxID=935616 RepID=UPI003643145B